MRRVKAIVFRKTPSTHTMIFYSSWKLNGVESRWRCLERISIHVKANESSRNKPLPHIVLDVDEQVNVNRERHRVKRSPLLGSFRFNHKNFDKGLVCFRIKYVFTE